MDAFIQYLDEQAMHLQEEELSLRLEDRMDESNLHKVKINIFGMCKAIYSTVARQNEAEAVKDVYLKRLEEFLDNWKRSYEKAKAYDDTKKAVIEDIKLSTMQEIQDYFIQIGGDGGV